MAHVVACRRSLRALLTVAQIEDHEDGDHSNGDCRSDDGQDSLLSLESPGAPAIQYAVPTSLSAPFRLGFLLPCFGVITLATPPLALPHPACLRVPDRRVRGSEPSPQNRWRSDRPPLLVASTEFDRRIDLGLRRESSPTSHHNTELQVSQSSLPVCGVPTLQRYNCPA